MITSGLAFIASHLNVTGEVPVEIIPGYWFRPARDSEITYIKEMISRLSIAASYGQWVNYEAVIHEERDERGTTFHSDLLPREKWKYWVVAFEGTNDLLHDLEKIVCLLHFDFDIGFTFLYGSKNQQEPRMGWLSPRMHIIEKYSHPDQIHKNAQEIDSGTLSSIHEIWNTYASLPIEYSFVKSALDNLYALKRVPQSSGLVVVGLFSIIESLITHAPRLNETLDSINHQVTNKLILLRKRYSRQVQYDSYFLHANEEGIWKKLYSYRSGVAHGNPISFSAELQVLKNHNSVVAFLQANVRELLKLAVNEPEFISDLRKC